MSARDDHLVIIGAGGVGGSAVHIAPAVIAGKIIVADLDPQKRAHARQMGAVETIDNSAPDAVKQVMQATGGGAAAAIDFVGAPETMSFGINVLRKGGKLVMVGLYGGSCPVSTVLFPFKMMSVEGSYVGTLEDLRELLALGKQGKVPPIPIETRPADQATQALSDLKSGGKVRGRVVLRHQENAGRVRTRGLPRLTAGREFVTSGAGERSQKDTRDAGNRAAEGVLAAGLNQLPETQGVSLGPWDRVPIDQYPRRPGRAGRDGSVSAPVRSRSCRAATSSSSRRISRRSSSFLSSTRRPARCCRRRSSSNG